MTEPRERPPITPFSPQPLAEVEVEALEVVPQPIVVAGDSRRSIVYGNPAFLKLVAAKDERELATLDLVQLVHPDDLSKFVALGDPGVPSSERTASLRLVLPSGRSVQVMARGRLMITGRREKHWVYHLQPMKPDFGVTEEFENRIAEQKKRLVEAVQSSMNIYSVTEKLRSVPKLSALLFEIDEEGALLRSAGDFLQSEGFDYREVSILTFEGDELQVRYSSDRRRAESAVLPAEGLYKCLLEHPGPLQKSPLDFVLPLRDQDHHTIGILEIRLDPREQTILSETDFLRDWHFEVLETIAEILALSLVNVRLYEQLHQQTILDPLTGTFNRQHLIQVLERELPSHSQRRRPLCLIFTDLDGFKEINDTYGHPEGDHVIREIVRIFREQLDEGDLICRYGGDEFVIVLPESKIKAAAEKAERLRSTVAAHRFAVRGPEGQVEVGLTLSVGLATSQDGENAEQILQVADVSLYGAKRGGRNRICYINESSSEDVPSEELPSVYVSGS